MKILIGILAFILALSAVTAQCPTIVAVPSVTGHQAKEGEELKLCDPESIDVRFGGLGSGACIETPLTFEECAAACKAETDNSPVCGSDGKTYSSSANLECVNSCIELPNPITIISNGPCSDKKPPVDINSCVQACPRTPEYNPVCGTDGVTYFNRGHLDCRIYCKPDVQFARMGVCPRPTPAPTPSPTPTPTRSPTPTPTFKPSPTPTQRPVTPGECERSCPKSSDMKPVCGSDGKTYANIEELDCQNDCVSPVQVVKTGSCSDSSDPFEHCVLECPRPIEYRPVCGSDNVTYDNRGVLDCRSRCGQKLRFKKMGQC